MTDANEMTGRCLCGNVAFTASNVELEHHVCHCAMCRRWGGSPFFGIHVGEVIFSGEENIVRFDSSEWAARGFCGTCGTNLFYFMKADNRYSICAGAFDDQSGFTLTNEIFIDHKPPGYRFSGNLPSLTEAEAIAKYMPQG